MISWDLLEKWDVIFGVVGGIVFVINAVYYMPKLIATIARQFRSSYIEGNWHGYYFVFVDGKSQLTLEKWVIKKGLRENLVVNVETVPEKIPSYKGEVQLQRDNLVVNLKAQEYPVETFTIFKAPIPGNDNIITGIWLGLDLNGEVMAGPGVLSRKPLSEKELRELLFDKIQSDSYMRTVRLA